MTIGVRHRGDRPAIRRGAFAWFLALPAFLVVAWAATAACSAESPSDAEAVRLRFGYAEGDTLRYDYRTVGTVTMPDTADATTRSREYERTMQIEEVALEVTPLDHVVLALTYITEPKRIAEADTLAPTDDDAPTGGKSDASPPDSVSLVVEMTTRGRIVRVTGAEDARRMFGDLDFQSMFEQTQPVFPDRRLEAGDSWTQTVKVLSPSREPVETSSTYVLEELTEIDGEAVAVIRFDGDIYLPVTFDPDVSPGGLQSVEQEIRLRGTIHFAHERGVIRRVEHTAEGTVRKVSLREGRPVRTSVRVDQETSIRLVEKRP